MIRNTEAFYVNAKKFQQEREKLVSEYEKTLKGMKRYEGSSGYKEDLEKLQKKHSEALTALQDEYRRSLRIIMSGMSEAVSKRKVNPPTNEQLNLLHLLKMREKVSEEELDRIAEMVKDNGIAMGVVQEVANSNGIVRNYQAMCKEMSSSYAQKQIQSLGKGLEDWLLYDTKKSGRLAQKYYQDKYGLSPQEELPKRDLFEDMEGCFREIAGMDQEELKLFSQAVDGE